MDAHSSPSSDHCAFFTLTVQGLSHTVWPSKIIGSILAAKRGHAAMANPEHLRVLKLGAPVWNKWREEHPDLRADLTGAALREVILSEANLSRVDFCRATLDLADFSGANLDGANLGEAELNAANISKANLSRASLNRANLHVAVLNLANLRNADLRSVDLGGANCAAADLRYADLRLADLRATNFMAADLTGVKLDGANLGDAGLSGANFTRATVGGTIFADVDLSVAKGLETVIHYGPSTVGIDTIYRSRGNIPEVFLRGCGVPDEFIAYIGSLVGRPIEFYSCFISYSSKDQEFADRLYADLQSKGVRCWFAPHDIKGGRKLHEQLDEAIRLHDKLLLVLSEHSMNSRWVKTEIANARAREEREKKQMLFPITVAPFADVQRWKLFDADQGGDSAREIREYFIPDFSNWKDHDSYQTAFQRLVKDLKAEASK